MALYIIANSELSKCWTRVLLLWFSVSFVLSCLNILHLCVQCFIPSWIKPKTAKSLFVASQLSFKEWEKRLVVSEAWSCVREWRTSGCCFCELSLPLNVTCSLYDISEPLLISCSATNAHSPLTTLLAIFKISNWNRHIYISLCC